MTRILVVLVLLLGAIVIIPPLRERARPQIDWALTPVYRWETKNRLNSLVRMLVRERAQGARTPHPREFHRFLTQRGGDSGARDPWGEYFFLEIAREGMRVGSSGPDRRRGTSDDIYSALQPITGR